MSWEYDDESDEPDYEADETAARAWARDLLARPGDWIILDLETTGLGDGGYGAEPVQIAVLSPSGEVLLDTLCRPLLGTVPEDAAEIHGITTQILQSQAAPPFAEVYPRLVEVTLGKVIVCYNASFDRGVLRYACERAGVALLLNDWQCAMEQYAAYVGDWSAWWGSYKWQKLPRKHSRLHGALGDCRAVLALIQEMASTRESEVPG